MRQEEDFFRLVKNVAPIGTIASLSLTASAFCKENCENAVGTLSFSAIALIGSLFLITWGLYQENVKFRIWGVGAFFIGIFSLGISAVLIITGW